MNRAKAGGRRLRRFPCLQFAAILGIAGFMSIATAPGIYAQTATGIYAAFTGAITAQPDDLVDSGVIGGQLGYRAPGSWFVFGEYLYAGKDFYYFEKSEWHMSASWLDVPSGSVSRNDWIFYRDRHAVGLAGGLSGAIGEVGFFGAAGVMLNLVLLSDAADSYPEFEQAATRSSIGESTVLFTTTFRGGVVWPAHAPVAGQAAVMVQLEPTRQSGDTGYLRRNTYFFLGVVFQTGPISSEGNV
ncbi:MAG: hypothetical protein WCY01_05165 [Alkalispirochaeta sp.]